MPLSLNFTCSVFYSLNYTEATSWYSTIWPFTNQRGFVPHVTRTVSVCSFCPPIRLTYHPLKTLLPNSKLSYVECARRPLTRSLTPLRRDYRLFLLTMPLAFSLMPVC